MMFSLASIMYKELAFLPATTLIHEVRTAIMLHS